MDNWKASLDRYLTSEPPDDGFEDWITEISEKHIKDEDWKVMEDWFNCQIPNGLNADNVLNYCFKKYFMPAEAAMFITKHFYKNVKHKL